MKGTSNEPLLTTVTLDETLNNYSTGITKPLQKTPPFRNLGRGDLIFVTSIYETTITIIIKLNDMKEASDKTDIKTLAMNLSDEEVNRIQQFFDGKRKLDADELTFNPDFPQILNELVEQGRITLPPMDDAPGFHSFWSSWNHLNETEHSSLNPLH